ncbi:family 16 glycoside hydrolase [Rufibacter aurantiacus]|uniref:family 16 glycoside hydrolase n=1 Tax=Rufibacter aurantiacus TaxID=2817374 RepID=UPI001B30F2C9|nr:family 16 glycoside hydrolase [Rufibacter aurantiacus]
MLNSRILPLKRGALAFGLLASLAFAHPAQSQSSQIPLNDLSAFKNPGKSWQVAGSVSADLQEANKLLPSNGAGVLVNLPGKKVKGEDLFTNFEHGDMDLELDYMMAKGSNSGIYLQGRYELQLFDGWGFTDVSSSGNGAVYERWDDSRPEGQKGYQGYAPRQNAGRAPGLWQHLKIAFQAPRFDVSGKKTQNARLLRVELNGVTIHEDLELFGPTRGAISNEETAMGPLRIQGDHGAVAFRNIKVNHFSKPRPELKNLTYKIYKGKYQQEPAYGSLPPEAAGPKSQSAILTSNLGIKDNQFLMQYTGTFVAKEPGEYTFNLSTPAGYGLLRVNKQEVAPIKYWNGGGTVKLPAGEFPFELVYIKYNDWGQPALGLQVAGPGVREFLISEVNLTEEADPILVDVKERPVLRSFMDLPGNHRVTHGVSVGSPTQLHYTYDLDNGSLVQLWRGAFLDATPMWHERGDGSSKAIGSVQYFGKPTTTLAKLSSEQAAWVTDTTGISYKGKGYRLDQNSEPTFQYQIYGTTVQDAFKIIENGKGLRRELSIQNPTGGLYARLAEGAKIEEAGKGMYLVDDRAYYVRLEDTAGAKPVIRTVGGRQELVVPVQGKVAYSILF